MLQCVRKASCLHSAESNGGTLCRQASVETVEVVPAASTPTEPRHDLLCGNQFHGAHARPVTAGPRVSVVTLPHAKAHPSQ